MALVDWALAERPFPGETVSGDLCVVEDQGAAVLVAVIDGLGHGADAAEAAAAVGEAVREHRSEPLPAVMQAAHRRAGGTRGAAVTLARFAAGGVELLAVGNVSGVIVRPRAAAALRRVPLRGGIVGFRLPSLGQVDQLPLEPEDRVVFASDGIRSRFARRLDPALAPAVLAERLLAGCARDSDDATVLVARYLGTP